MRANLADPVSLVLQMCEELAEAARILDAALWG